MKIIFIGLLILIGVLDIGLLIMCSHMENREQYKHMKGQKERASDDKCRLHKAYVGRTII